MFTILFQGFFQCRLATDADHYREKRGKLGWTFAFGSEPDLDRIVRFQNPVALRTHSPSVAVNVTAVNGKTSGHPLIGAPVDLLANPVLEGHDGQIAIPGNEPLSPINWRLMAGTLVIARGTAYDPTDPIDRAPFMGKGVGPLTDPMVRGVPLNTDQQSLAYRAQRLAALTSDLADTGDIAVSAILKARMDKLRTQNAGPPVSTLHFAVNYNYPLKDQATIADPHGQLDARLDPVNPWQTTYWMGAWDADTLTGYVRGTLEIPTLN